MNYEKTIAEQALSDLLRLLAIIKMPLITMTTPDAIPSTTTSNPAKPEAEFLGLIDKLFLKHWVEGCPIDEWEGSATEFAELLTDSLPSHAADLARLLTFKTACGCLLAKLADSHPDRFSKRTVHGTALWTVKPQLWED